MIPKSVDRRFSLDSNVLVYAVDRDANANRRGLALALMARAAMSDCVLTLQSLAEFFAATTRKRLLRPEDASAFVGDWLAVFPVVPNAAEDLVDAMEARERFPISFWEAMLWATVRRAGCSAILSEDFQDGRSLHGVQFLNPFLPENEEHIERLLDT